MTTPISSLQLKSIDDFDDVCEFRAYKNENFEIIKSDFSKQLTKTVEKFQYAKVLHQLATDNPTNLTNPYWQWIVACNLSPDNIEIIMNGDFSYYSQAFWGMERMGQTRTLLADGREIWIGGEFEDYYDPQFFIYNDVIVKHPNGDIEIYGYPLDIFPATDFHSATLIDNKIWLIGSLGYQEQRQYKQTQVFTLDIDTYQIQAVKTKNSMGLIYKHTADYQDGKIVLSGGYKIQDKDAPIIEQINKWTLDLQTLTWKNCTNYQWQIFMIKRADNSYFSLWDFDNALFDKKYNKDNFAIAVQKLEEKLGIAPNFELFANLYNVPLEHSIDKSELEYNENAIFINEVRVRYVDNGRNICVYVEGNLPQNQLAILQEDLIDKLTILENSPCVIEKIRE